MRALLDVNVLMALLDAAHVGHASATRWLAREVRQGWASCPLTQNGGIRVMSQLRTPDHWPGGGG
jgi:predicted nucleic acid-binding protein